MKTGLLTAEWLMVLVFKARMVMRRVSAGGKDLIGALGSAVSHA